MSSFGPFVRCKVCGAIDFKDRHRCPPMFRCRFEHDDVEDWRTVHASDLEEAAAKFCEQVDQEGDYHVIQRGSATVLAKPADSDTPWSVVHVSAESRPHYTGRTAS